MGSAAILDAYGFVELGCGDGTFTVLLAARMRGGNGSFSFVVKMKP